MTKAGASQMTPDVAAMGCAALIDALEDCRLPAAAFDHRAHVQVGFGYLQRHGYAGALAAMARSLRRFAAHHGKAGLYHETITVAFLALIHQRMAEDLIAAGGRDPTTLDWTDFAARHPDLFAPDMLGRYYRRELLATDLARRCFVLPRVMAGSEAMRNPEMTKKTSTPA
jgi:hypothetical protein